MKNIKEVALSGRRVFFRVDFNVPLDEGQKITDDSRIRAVLPTLQYALASGAKVIVASHLGRPEGKKNPKMSLLPVAQRLGELLEKPVRLAGDCIGPEVKKLVQDMQAGDVVMLENLRFYPQEQKNDPSFAEKLAELCDVYVNDAFAVSHRADASVAGIVKFAPRSVSGFLLQREMDYFHKAMTDPRRPLVAIVGGAKVSDKLRALENMLQHVDKIIIGGAMANTFLKGQGCFLGKSRVEEDLVEASAAVIRAAAEKGVTVYLPVDAVVADRFDPGAATKIVPVHEIPADWMVMDIGPASSILFAEALSNAKTIVWNGPMGVFEMDAFSRGTLAMVTHVANAYALTIVGGGDTDAAVHMAKEAQRITYISTGGGAFLALLEGKQLPGVAALDEAGEK
ncbi:MAG: phosphoglycerate kinase [Desulfobacterales bacterium]|nr:phosphoglycerate kinase [Desulfobacterales bacterium]